jgi:hypothetical protein
MTDRIDRIERRTRRSSIPVEALSMFLSTQRSSLKARALAVMTREGKLLAAAGPAPEQLARMALEVHEAPHAPGDKTKVATWWLRAGGFEVILASRGGRLSHDLGSGVKRILAS